ncbi:hypothetical protein OH491_20725 [Termitidicoccus mucosus]|uniref:PIN domain-containing protein n=1 Tax=Termitidicoccus mucosus TaxID=1184151 RepID=A0A178IE56_9BACT|nr:hypothetical protein AW736_22995 [Opitutaceae bacterium TSB47]
MTAAIADRWRRHSPRQLFPVSDGLLAAPDLEHRLSIVTRNVADFRRSGVNIINPISQKRPPAKCPSGLKWTP